MRKKICGFPSCNALIDSPSVYCEKHTKPKAIPFQNAMMTNTKLYNTSTWRKLKANILKNQPYCNNCGATEKLEVHHSIPPKGNPELFYDESNLVPLCQTCHRIASNKEIRSKVKIWYLNIIYIIRKINDKLG